jgi:hypothetical protein
MQRLGATLDLHAPSVAADAATPAQSVTLSSLFPLLVFPFLSHTGHFSLSRTMQVQIAPEHSALNTLPPIFGELTTAPTRIPGRRLALVESLDGPMRLRPRAERQPSADDDGSDGGTRQTPPAEDAAEADSEYRASPPLARNRKVSLLQDDESAESDAADAAETQTPPESPRPLLPDAGAPLLAASSSSSSSSSSTSASSSSSASAAPPASGAAPLTLPVTGTPNLTLADISLLLRKPPHPLQLPPRTANANCVCWNKSGQRSGNWCAIGLQSGIVRLMRITVP